MTSLYPKTLTASKGYLMQTNKAMQIYVILGIAVVGVVIFWANEFNLPSSLSTEDAVPKHGSSASKLDDATLARRRHKQVHTSLLDLTQKIASFRQQSNTANHEALTELKALVADDQHRYEAVLKKYQDAINDYDLLAADFDAKVRQGEIRERLVNVDKQRLEKAHEVLALQQTTNEAYLKLMARYDASISKIMAKYFAVVQR